MPKGKITKTCLGATVNKHCKKVIHTTDATRDWFCASCKSRNDRMNLSRIELSELNGGPTVRERDLGITTDFRD